VSNAFEIAKDVSELPSEEIGFQLDLCCLCVALTRENRKSLGLIIKEVIYYFTDVASHDLSNPSIQDKFSNEVQLSLRTKLPHLSPSELAVIGSVLKASLANLEDTTQFTLHQDEVGVDRQWHSCLGKGSPRHHQTCVI
jgi:hypothetical protein